MANDNCYVIIKRDDYVSGYGETLS